MKMESMVQSLPLALFVGTAQLPATTRISEGIYSSGLHHETPKAAQTASTDAEPLMTPPRPVLDKKLQIIVIRGEKSNWDRQHEKRFVDLIEKEALDTISSNEYLELEELQRLRRRFVAPPAFDEIIARHRSEKFNRELVNVLTKYVNISDLPKNSTKA